MASKEAIDSQFTSWAPPAMTMSCMPDWMSMKAWPRAWAPEAQAPLTVHDAPCTPKKVLRLMVTVEFITCRILPEPMWRVSPCSRKASADSTAAWAQESLPTMSPARAERRASIDRPAWRNASTAAPTDHWAGCPMDLACLRLT